MESLFLKFLKDLKIFFIDMSVLAACIHVYYRCAWCLSKLEEAIGSLRTGAMDICKTTSACWDTNLGALQEQVLSITKLFLLLLYLKSIIIIIIICVWGFFPSCMSVHLMHMGHSEVRQKHQIPWD